VHGFKTSVGKAPELYGNLLIFCFIIRYWPREQLWRWAFGWNRQWNRSGEKELV